MENQNKEKLRDSTPNGSNENSENKTTFDSAPQQEEHLQNTVSDDSKSSSEMDSDQRTLEQNEQEEARRNYESTLGHKTTDKFHRAISQFDPKSTEVQDCEHWTFKDPELDIHGHF